MADQGGGGAGRAFSGGFFGCFGVLAAFVAAFLLLAMCGVMRETRTSDRIARGGAEPRDLVTTCAAAASQAERAFRRIGKLDPSIDPPTIVSQGPPVEIVCLASNGRGPVAFTVTVICANPLEPDCHFVSGARQGGKALSRR